MGGGRGATISVNDCWMLSLYTGCLRQAELSKDGRRVGGGKGRKCNNAEVEFVTAGGSVKFLPAVLISPLSLIFCVFSY